MYRLYCVIFILCIGIYPIFGQREQHTNKTIVLKDSTVGKATYQTIAVKRNKIFDGAFQFLSEKVVNEQQEVSRTIIEGNYTQGLKNGKWQFKTQNLAQSNDAQWDGYSFVKSANGFEKNVTAFFDKGNASGIWQAKRFIIESSQIKDTILSAKLSFVNGYPFGKWESNTTDISIHGRFENDANPHGEFVFIHHSKGRKVKEVRQFKNGLLIQHYVESDGNRIELPVFTSNYDEKTTVESMLIQAKYFEILEFMRMDILQNRSTEFNEAARIAKIGDKAFLEGIKYFTQYQENDLWMLTEGTTNVGNPSVKLLSYPLTKDELKTYKETTKHLKRIQELLHYFDENTALKLHSQAYELLAEKEALFNVLKSSFQSYFSVQKVLESPYLAYIHHQKLWDDISVNVELPEDFEYRFQERFRQKDLAEWQSFVTHTRDFSEWSKGLLAFQKKLETEVAQIDKIVDQIVKQTELKSIEEKMISLKDSIVSKFENRDNDSKYNSFHAEFRPTVKLFIENHINDYSKLPIEDKKEQIDFYVACLNYVKDLYVKLSDVPKRRERLNELYTRSTFNPYTYTTMQERVKSRVYEVYDEVLFPHIWSSIQSNFSCGTLTIQLQKWDALYRKMVDIREEDTKVLERSLRRVKDPNLAWELLFEMKGEVRND